MNNTRYGCHISCPVEESVLILASQFASQVKILQHLLVNYFSVLVINPLLSVGLDEPNLLWQFLVIHC